MSEDGSPEDTPRGPTILLAEDDLAQRLLYTRILIAAGYYVLSAENGIDALTIARRDVPGLVLMDVTMSGKDGWSTARELKGDARTRHIPIILMTGLSVAINADVSRTVGWDEFLTKPIPVRELLAAVNKLLPPLPVTRARA